MNISVPTLRGGTRLVFDAVEGITSRVERMHESIANPPVPGLRRQRQAHGPIAASIYASIRGVNGLLREAADSGYRLLQDDAESMPAAELRTVAALNGAVGDHLEATDNALAQPMTLLYDGEPLALDGKPPAGASPHVVLFVHGLGLSELNWQNDTGSMGDRLREELALTPLYLRYNTGRHISTNGRELAGLLETLCEQWPVPVESLSLVGHSMGGLVIRSACWYAGESGAGWMSALKRVVCLGSPHHGAPLEKAGHALDLALQRIPYAEPLVFGKQRSAGIKDLRYGNLLDEDWMGRDPDAPEPDNRAPVPLVPGVDYYFIAGTIGRARGDVTGELLGDLLVRLDSAVGSHRDDLKRLDISPGNCRVFFRKNHFDLLTDCEVHQQIVEWFGGG